MLYEIKEKDKEKYINILKEYFKYYRHLKEEEALKQAKDGYTNLVNGLDLSGDPLEDINYFDDRLANVTFDYWSPTNFQKGRYKLETPKRNVTRKTKTISKVDKVNEKEVEKMKRTLLNEYPFLANRRDLEDTIDNYCGLSLKTKQLLNSPSEEKQSMGIKSLVDAQINLGKYLGIAEADRQKQKIIEDRDNIASLSLQFQVTIEEYPELQKMFKFFELKMLLKKYERKEISRALFQLDSYAGLTIEEAYQFVTQHKEYEQNTKN